MRFFCAALVLVAAALAPPAHALDLGERPAQWLGAETSPAQGGRLASCVQEQTTAIFGEACTQALALKPVAFDPQEAIVDPAAVLAKDMRNAGGAVWRERLEATVCSRPVLLNIIACRPNADHSPPAPFLYARIGETRMSLGVAVLTQNGLLPGAVQTAEQTNSPGRTPPNPGLVFLETRLVQPAPAATNWTQPWQEEWKVRACRALDAMRIDFTPNPNSSRYVFAIREAPCQP
jgi:hypothetical protein